MFYTILALHSNTDIINTHQAGKSMLKNLNILKQISAKFVPKPRQTWGVKAKPFLGVTLLTSESPILHFYTT